MKENSIEDFIRLIDSDNSKYEILLNRIDILNRIIKELEKSNDDYLRIKLQSEDNDDKNKEIEILKLNLKEKEEEINKLNYEKALYKKENEKYKDIIKDYKSKQQDEQKNIEELNGKLNDLTNIIESMNQKKEFYSKLDDVYFSYCDLDDSIKEMFEGFIFTDSIEAFVSSISNEQKLKRFYTKINDYVMCNQSKIKDNEEFFQQERILAKLFDFYFECLMVIDKNTNYGRINVVIDQDYDDEICTRIGEPYGKIEDVLIQGYTINDELISRSIVLVRE